MLEGLSGKTHTSVSDILKEDFNVKNKILLAAGGFAGDVATDPLTYLGLGRVPGMGIGEANIRAAQQLNKAVDAGEMSVSGARAALQGTKQEIKAANPFKWKLEVGLPWDRRPVAEFKDPAVVDKLRDVIRGPEGDERKLVKMLSRKAELPYGMAEAHRQIQAKYTGDANDIQRVLGHFHNEVDPSSRHIASLAFDDPEVMAQYRDTPLVTKRMAGAPSPVLDEWNIHTIGDYVDKVHEHLTDLARNEYELGLHRGDLPTQRVMRRVNGRLVPKQETIEWEALGADAQQSLAEQRGRNVYKHVNKPDELQVVKGIARQMGQSGHEYFSARGLKWDVIPERAEPVIDIAESHLGQLAQSMRDQSQAVIVHSTLQDLGVHAAHPQGRELMRAFSLNPDANMRFSPVQGDLANALKNEVAQHSAYKNMQLPESIATILNSQEQIMTSPSLARDLVRMSDRVMGRWKAANTVLSPGYFARTTLGDMMQNVADGVWDFRRYIHGDQVLRSVRKNELTSFADTLRDDAGELLHSPRVIPDEPLIDIGGRKVPASEVYNTATESGIQSGQIVTERQRGSIIGSAQEPGGNFGMNEKDVGGMLKQVGIADAMRTPISSVKDAAMKGVGQFDLAAAKMSDLNIGRETRLRLTHFIDRWDKEIKQGLRDYAKKAKIDSKDFGAIREHMGQEGVTTLERKAAETAGSRVRKFNIDYGGLSTIEKEYINRVIPFYTFFRKNAPLQLSMLLTNPSFHTLAPKGIEAFQNLIGTNEGDGDWMIPDWIRESLPVRMAVAGQKGNIINQIARFASGSSDDNSVFLNMFPSLLPSGDIETVLGPAKRAYDTGSAREGIGQALGSLMNMTGPAIKMPAEGAFNRSFYSGAPISDYKEWAVSGLLGAPGRVAWPSFTGGERAVAPAWVGFAAGPRPFAVGQRDHHSAVAPEGSRQAIPEYERWTQQ
jgi:hypothetical protein